MPPVRGQDDLPVDLRDRPDIAAAANRQRRQHRRRAHAPERQAIDRFEPGQAPLPGEPAEAAHPANHHARAARPPHVRRNAHIVPLADAPPLRDVDTHRSGADRDTQKSMLALYRAFPVDDAQADTALDAVEQFIRDYVGNSANIHGALPSEEAQSGPVMSDDTALRDNALRTLVDDASAPQSSEPFKSIRDPSNTYVTGSTNRYVVLPTSHFAASAWNAIASLPSQEQHRIRLLYVSALAACQQDGHICAPGQLQQIAAHMAPEFKALISIRPPVREPHDYSAELFRFIKRKAGGDSAPVPPHERDAVIAFTHKIWNDLETEDARQVLDGYLDAYMLPQRKYSLRQELNRLVNDTYDLEWSLPEMEPAPARRIPTPMPGVRPDFMDAMALLDRLPRENVREIMRHVLANDPMQANFGNQLMAPEPADDVYGHALREIWGPFMENRDPDEATLAAFHEHALEQARERWPGNGLHLFFFDTEVRRYLLVNYGFTPRGRELA